MTWGGVSFSLQREYKQIPKDRGESREKRAGGREQGEESRGREQGEESRGKRAGGREHCVLSICAFSAKGLWLKLKTGFSIQHSDSNM